MRKRLYDPHLFGARIWANLLRDGQRLSYQDAAKEIGVSAATVCRIIQGKAPSVENFLRFSVWLGLREAGDLVKALNEES